MVTTPTRPVGRKPVMRQHSRAGTPPAAAPRTPGTPSTGSAATGPAKKGLGGHFGRFWMYLEGSEKQASGASYYMILGSALALTAIGLMMVLSASSVEAIAEGTSEFDLFLRQAIWAAGGLVLMLLLSRFGARTYRLLAWPVLGVAIVLLMLVLVIGVNINGNQNWIQIGGFTMQPSEPAKLALAIWLASVLARKGRLVRNWKHAMIPALPLGGLPIGLVLLGGDLGTVIILMMILAAALFFAGAPMKMFTIAGIAGIAGALVMVLVSGNRSDRISAWLRINCDDGRDLCLQSDNGLFALASGGWWGVGIGQSRQKWNWIPEAHNDFIFAIIGEEFGLIGTLVVVALFGILAVATIRVARRYTDPFVRILLGSILVWLIGQAFVNIGMVTGVLPVIGVPLPFISYGGSALTFTLAAVGVLLSFARKMPPAPAADAAVTPDARFLESEPATR
ncbi:putative lipid II flippase FtsW [Arthrobacter sp. HLT1-21]